jgi:SAM-dependent methyltransferase
VHDELLELLRCPRSGQALVLEGAEYERGRIRCGWLVSESGAHRYPINDFIPRFVPQSNYADNFGMQWNRFRRTQLDSYSGQPISASRFWKATGWQAGDLAGQWVLDAGCGAGRFAEVALQAGARVLALDYSGAVDACYANLGHHEQLHLVQGDIYALPLRQQFFPFVYSLGVLQHTPDVAGALAALPPCASAGARICVDFYWRRLRTVLHSKYLLRPITKRIPQQRLFGMLETVVPVLLPISRQLGRVPVVGRVLKRAIPVADYSGVYPLSETQLQEWALLDTFDMLAPVYDNPQTAARVAQWLRAAGLVDVEVFHEGHLVARGRKVHDSRH